MRRFLNDELIKFSVDGKFIFLTGDLGFKTFEPLKFSLGKRFINAGVAEQNMVSVAAGLASAGFNPWIYSIAPFVYARAFEQIRNDICFHRLPVKIVGNGGGYGYGVMGGTHHALEDYGTLLTLQNMKVFVPAFNDDISSIINKMINLESPAYLRLGLDEKPRDFILPKYSGWRQLMKGERSTILTIGPIVGDIIKSVLSCNNIKMPNLWLISELPIQTFDIPLDFVNNIMETDLLIVIEEHVAQGGIGYMLSNSLLKLNIKINKYIHLYAKGYPSGMYGSQKFHRAENRINGDSIVEYLGNC